MELNLCLYSIHKTLITPNFPLHYWPIYLCKHMFLTPFDPLVKSTHAQICCYSQNCGFWRHLWNSVQLKEHASDRRTEAQTSGRTLGVSQCCRQGEQQQQNCKHHNHAHSTHKTFSLRAGQDATGWLAQPP